MKKKLLIIGIAFLSVTYAKAQSSTTTTTIINQTTTNPQQQEAPTPQAVTPPEEKAVVATPVVEEKDKDHSKAHVPVFYIGARIMGTISTFKVNTFENNNVTVAKTKVTLGYGGGVYLGFNITKCFAIQPEILYSTLSQKYVDKGLNRRIDISYVNVPLMFVLNTNITKPVNFNIAAGPQLGINTGAKVSSVSQGNTEVINSKFAVKATDFGFAYGAGLDFRIIPALSIDLGFRGVMGLIDISDKNATATYTTTDNGVTTIHTVAVMDKSKVSSYGGYLGLRLNF